MNMKQKKTRKKLLIGILVIVVSLVVFRDPVNTFSAGANKLLLPLKIIIYKTTRVSKETFNNLKDINKIIKENEALKSKNYKLNLENLKLQNLVEENKTLKSLLKFKEESQVDFAIANIKFRDPLSVYDEFFIDLGSDDGIKKDMVVLNKDVLLGKVSKVYKDKAIVDFISKNGVYTSILIGEEKNIGVLKGENSNTLSIEYIVNDADIKIGDRVVTSGISDIYPKGQYIGEVSSVEEKEGELFKKVKLNLPFNIFEIKEVIILK